MTQEENTHEFVSRMQRALCAVYSAQDLIPDTTDEECLRLAFYDSSYSRVNDHSLELYSDMLREVTREINDSCRLLKAGSHDLKAIVVKYIRVLPVAEERRRVGEFGIDVFWHLTTVDKPTYELPADFYAKTDTNKLEQGRD